VRRWLFVVLGLLALLLSAAFFFPQQVLCVDSGEVQADALVVLGGGSYERPTRAAELFKAGATPRVIVSGTGDCASNRQLMMDAGVPSGAIELEGNSRSTRQNAQFSIPLLREGRGGKAEMLRAEMLKSEGRDGNTARPQHRMTVILVTSWYHSRRALHTFQHYAPDIQFYSRPSYFGYPRTQWSRDGIKGYIRAEYVKLAGYWVCYGVCPF
jgi:uncharacterized SAM-binding protein YcdF (DUF218 family)